MEAVYIHGIRDVRIGRKDPPSRSNDRVRLRVASVGICGSDLHYYLEGSTGGASITEPFVPGHEFSGYLEEDVPERGLAAGQLVAVDPARPCGRCEWCHAGHPNLCPNVEFTGAPPLQGAMTEVIALDPHQLFAVPETFTPDQAMMLEPLGVAVHALNLARLALMDTVAVLGCGPIGLCMVRLARLRGASRIYAVDPVPYRAAKAREYGADEAGDRVGAILDWTAGRGVDLVLEATNSGAALQLGGEAVAIGGQIVLVGIPEGDSYSAQASLLRRKGVGIKLSRRMGEVYPQAIRLVADGLVDVEGLISHRFSLEDTPQAFALQADYRDGALKSVIRP